MDSHDLTPEQCRVLGEQLRPIQVYLNRLHDRVCKQAFPADDKVRVLIEKAHDAVFSLTVELHYLSIPSGVHRTKRDGKP